MISRTNQQVFYASSLSKSYNSLLNSYPSPLSSIFPRTEVRIRHSITKNQTNRYHILTLAKLRNFENDVPTPRIVKLEIRHKEVRNPFTKRYSKRNQS